VTAALEAARTDVGAPAPESGDLVIVGDNNTAVEAAAKAAQADGFIVEIAWREATGEASRLGRDWIARCRAASAGTNVLCGGGEATVTVLGDGVGGRNTEFSLAAAIALAEEDVTDWVAASLATDGDDGPTRVAGAIADPSTVARAAAAGIDAPAALANNDSLRVFEAAGGIVKPGPTGTNVNDVYLAVRITPS
jgi:hydroxypyruvate reductase